MGLAFRGAGSDRSPADQISDVLGNHRIQQFRRCRHALTGQVQQ